MRTKTVLKAVTLALATRRLTHLVVEDKITEDLREAVFKRHAPETTKLGYLFTCTRCSSVWAGLIVLLLGRSRLPGSVIVDTLALSEVSILVDEAVGASKGNSFFN